MSVTANNVSVTCSGNVQTAQDTWGVSYVTYVTSIYKSSRDRGEGKGGEDYIKGAYRRRGVISRFWVTRLDNPGFFRNAGAYRRDRLAAVPGNRRRSLLGVLSSNSRTGATKKVSITDLLQPLPHSCSPAAPPTPF